MITRATGTTAAILAASLLGAAGASAASPTTITIDARIRGDWAHRAIGTADVALGAPFARRQAADGFAARSTDAIDCAATMQITTRVLATRTSPTGHVRAVTRRDADRVLGAATTPRAWRLVARAGDAPRLHGVMAFTFAPRRIAALTVIVVPAPGERACTSTELRQQAIVRATRRILTDTRAHVRYVRAGS